VGLCLGTYGDPIGVVASHERGTPVGGGAQSRYGEQEVFIYEYISVNICIYIHIHVYVNISHYHI